MTDKILFVDDDPHLLAAFQRNLRKQFTFDAVAGPREALEYLQKQGPYAVIVADMRMPGMDGVTLLEHLRKLAPDTVRLMLTGNADQQTTMDAINRGQIFRFLSKPCPPDVLVPALQAAQRQYQLIMAERDLLEHTLTGSVQALIEVLALAVPEAHGRGRALRDATRELATKAGIGPLWELELAVELSPIGYAAVPHNVLRKLHGRVPLSFEEQAMVTRVPQVGHDLLRQIPRLENVARVVLFQQKNFDGSGFPHEHCVGTDIPAGARLLKVLHDRLVLEVEGTAGTAARFAMDQRTGFYDPALLQLCFATFPALLVETPGAGRPPLALNLDELHDGQRLYANITTSNGLVVAPKGQWLTQLTIQRLRNLADIGEVREPFLIHDLPGASTGRTPAATSASPS